MAATQTVLEFVQTVTPRPGVLGLFGYGVQVRVDRGHLIISDGIGSERRHFRLPRVGHGLKRLVVIGSDGIVSLAALRWLSDQKAAFIMLERDGTVLCTTGPVVPSDVRLRRAQTMAGQTGADVTIARELIHQKLAGQERVARDTLGNKAAAQEVADHRLALAEAETLDTIRSLESKSAAAYWAAWRDVQVIFPKKDLLRVPEHWRKFGTRKSILSGSPRLATNLANAMLNYLYALLESEARLAAAALGLDPGIGFLHVDTPARDSFACDLMEAVRPQVDRYVHDWILQQPLRREWFFEQHNGNCRLMAAFAAKLSETTPTWARGVAPLAEWVAQTLWSSARKPAHGDNAVPTRLTQRRRTEGRGREFIIDVNPAPPPSKICPGCGATTRQGRHCPTCGRAISRGKLIKLAKLGRVAAQGREARRKHSETQRRHEAAKRAWRSSPRPAWPDGNTYLREIQPRLTTVTISALSSTLGVCESYAADIRAGRHRPHPRHWKALADLAGIRSTD